MWEYSLVLDGPDGQDRILMYEFPQEMRTGDHFEHEGVLWEITEIAATQVESDGDPPYTLRCRPVR